MKVFISQPMMNKPNDILQKERAEVVRQLEAEGYTVLDSLFTLPEGQDSPLEYLAESIKLMAHADGIVFMQGWDMSRGCVMEYEIAMRYNKFVKIL